jgi:hypothetical protein
MKIHEAILEKGRKSIELALTELNRLIEPLEKNDNSNIDLEDRLDPENDLDIVSLFTGKKDVYYQNREAVERLEREVELMANIIGGGLGFTSIGGLLFFSPFFALIGTSILGLIFTQEYVWRVRRLYGVAKSILDHFGEDNVLITPRVRTDSAIVDLLVRMPDKRMFALAIRASYDVGIGWREDRQEFFVVKKGKKTKRELTLTKVMQSLESIYYLKKIKHPLIGKTSSERSAPLIKAIVLAPGARIITPKESPLWVKFGEADALKIQTTSVTYVVECEDLLKFLQPVEK